MSQPPVIVLPGITGSALEDWYPLEPEEVWTAVLKKKFERIALYPDISAPGGLRRYELNPSGDALGPARVTPRNAFDIAYGDLVEALRHELQPAPGKPTPVYGLGYDWRQDLNLVAAELETYIDEILARTELLPHYRGKNKPTKVDLVGHSSGGLIIARYLRMKQDKQQDSKVRRVVTMGTAFHGSIHAVQKFTTGMGNLTGPEPRDREREAARTIPHLYELLPSYPGAAIPRAAGVSTDLFEAATWQASVLESLRDYVKLRKATISGDDLFNKLLTDARDFVAAVNGLRLDQVLEKGIDDWLPIVGIDAKTHIAVEVGLEKNKVRFFFPDEVNDGPQSERTGDGTVPFLGACPDPGFLPRERLACVLPRDLSFFEVGDQILVWLGGLHGFLPRINLVQRLTIKFLMESFTGPVWARRAPGAAKTQWPKWLKEP